MGIDDPLSSEERIRPPASFVEQANVNDRSLRETFEREGVTAWARAGDLLDWETHYDEVLSVGDEQLTWFEGGTLNASYNCVDRHVEDGRKNTVAIRWEGTTGERRTYTYLDLYHEVNEVAAGLRSIGVTAGDVVTIYMPVMPELPITMLACARLGALHNVVFAGFSADELAARLDGTGSHYLVTCDGYYRRGNAVNQKNKADNARHAVSQDVETVVVSRLEDDPYLSADHHDYESLRDDHRRAVVEPVERATDDPLFVLYTSGTTGEPDQVTHLTGGYLAYATWTSHAVLDVKPADIYWCAADIAWITGHSYIVYGPLALGTTTLLYEGASDPPEKDRLWDLAERHRVDVFYTASTAVRAFMKWGAEHPDAHDLSSVRLQGTVGEPIDPRTWHWYRDHVGGPETPVVDTWWQTETGGIVVSTLPAVDEMRPGSAGPALPGIEVEIRDRRNEPVDPGRAGYLAVTSPWPGMPEGLVRAAATAGVDDWAHVTSDHAVLDEDGYVTFLGREDDTVTVGETAFGPATLERVVIEVEGVAEAAVVESTVRGNGAVAFICTERGVAGDAVLRDRIETHVVDRLGPTARFSAVVFAPELPKTHSGKIMRRVLSAITDGDEYGDTSALRNPETVGEIETVTDTTDFSESR
jgi:acetyl-CoA synthetase